MARMSTIARMTLATAFFFGPAIGQTNLLSNGGFESGATGWSNLPAGLVSSTSAHGGAQCVHMSTANRADVNQTVTVIAGRSYTMIGWIKPVAFTALGGNDWGYWYLGYAHNGEEQTYNFRSNNPPPGEWTKVALTFTAATGSTEVRFGIFGPPTTADVYFDDFRFFEKTSNQPPSAAPTASASSGTAPLTIAFTANADDPDGAIAVYQWLFGDGAESDQANPTHVFRSRGSSTVTLNVWDNDGVRTSATLPVTVTDNAAPTVTIASPSPNATFSTSAASVSLSGTAAAASAMQVGAVYWDNVSADTAGIVAVTPGASVNWNAGSVTLKPGKNEILVTAVQSDGKVAAARITITRTVSGPAISNVTASGTSVRMYEKYEVTFDLATVAEKTFFRYDDSPPPGVTPSTGVTVEGVFTLPGGATVRQPAFWFQESQPDAQSGGEPTHFAEPSPAGRWAVRFSPQQMGQYDVSIDVRDASGTATSRVGAFTAIAPQRHGFVRVSRDDPRYFEFSDRTFHFPLGPASGWDGATAGPSALNYSRPWMGGSGAYSTNWSRWKSTAEQWGNEGAMTPLDYTQHFPSHELSYRIFYPEGRRIWITAWCDDRFYHKFKSGSTYAVKIRLKTAGIAGPRDSGQPYGFVIKVHPWPNDTWEQDFRGIPSIIPAITADRDWHTVIVTYTHSGANNDLSLYLDNVTSGQVYVDQLSVREVLSGGALGGEIIRNSLADQHTYVEQRPAAWFDRQVYDGEADGVFFQYVVQDKNDWVPNHLNAVGVFNESGTGYYAADSTRTRWLQQQWWRYCAARWGYSTAVRAWELCNEGPPADPGSSHALTAQSFARFMHQSDAHPHLASTSFWCCWKPAFWGDNANYPDVNYADRHAYTEGNALGYDMAAWIDSLSSEMYADTPGKPIIIAETGISENFGPVSALAQPNDGTWYHNLLWAQLNHTGVSCPNYWFSEHFAQIDKDSIARPFVEFLRALDLNQGGYVPLGASADNADIRVSGQKNLAKGKAYAWIQNRTHTWARVMGVGGRGSVVNQSGTVSVAMSPNRSYNIYRYDTYTGATTSDGTVTADGSGAIAVTVSDLEKDFVLAIGFDPRVTVGALPHCRPGQLTALRCVLTSASVRSAARFVVAVPRDSRAALCVYDITGRLAATVFAGMLNAGANTVTWRPSDTSGHPLAPGMYLYRLTVPGAAVCGAVAVTR